MLNKIYLFLFLIFFSSHARWHKKEFTIMIDPAGDTKNVGRTLYNNFERGATLQFARELKKQIMQRYSHVSVVFTRSAGEALEKLQSAGFANRLNVDLYLSLNFYKETEVKPSVFIFYFKNQSFFSCTTLKGLMFCAYDQAFTINFNQTKKWADLMQKRLQQKKYQHYFSCKDAVGIPFKPLVGIASSAIGVEMGVKSNGWKTYTAPIVDSLADIINGK